jgi:putative endonuclease
MATHRTLIATYIMASGRNGTLYAGSTSNLESRVWKHRTRAFPGFSDAYDCTRLVWFEQHGSGASGASRSGCATGSWP